MVWADHRQLPYYMIESKDLAVTVMPTRDTDARIYQQELLRSEYDHLKILAKRKNISVQELVLEVMGEYLQGWESGSDLDIEPVLTPDNSVRLYLWVPYDKYDELCRETKKRGVHVQELVLKAIRQYAKKVDFN